jgi:hypothetical protein
MVTTHKTILVEDKSITEVLDINKEYLCSNGFRIKELHWDSALYAPLFKTGWEGFGFYG